MTCLRPQKVSSAAGYGPNKVIDYKLNRLYMLGIQACGGGKKEATRVAAFLGIGSNCLGHQFSQMEQELGKITSEFGKECMALNLQKELALSQRDDTDSMVRLKVRGDAAISSRGWEEVYINLLERMELEMSVALRGHLKQKDRDVKRQREYQSSPEAKRTRATLNNDKMKEECNKTKKDRRRGRTYKDTGDDDDVECDDGLETFMKIGQAVNQEVNTDNRVPTAKRTAKRKAPDQLICKSCGERGHGNRRSKKCRKFGKCHLRILTPT